MEEKKSTTEITPAARTYSIDLNRVETLSDRLSKAMNGYNQAEIALAFSYALANDAVSLFLTKTLGG